MKNLFNHYTLADFNKDLLENIKHKQVNFIQLFTTVDEAKVSVVLKPNDSETYYGLHPSFTQEELQRVLNLIKAGDRQSFWETIFSEQDKEKWFSLKESRVSHYPFSQNVYYMESLLLGRTVLQMASHYGYRFICSQEDKDAIKEMCYKLFNNIPLNNAVTNDIPDKTFYYAVNKDTNEIDIRGVWPKPLLEELLSNSHIYLINGNLHISKDQPFSVLKDDFVSIEALLSYSFTANRVPFRLLNSEVYYSGVMPRVIRIDYEDNHVTSSNVKYLSLEVGRTTFATVDCMDNPSILKHPYFEEVIEGERAYDSLIAFDRHEDSVQEKHLYDTDLLSKATTQRDYEKKSIKQINNYLSQSFNTHTVAVSANIETSDDYLLVGKRGKRAIDSKEYYCSSNGQSEFNDEHVDFYKQSVYEDLPTMNFKSNTRVDLNNEIHRETVAELGLSLFEKEWEYYGISFLSINNSMKNTTDSEDNKKNKDIQKRRMHFNVLTYNKAYHDFKSVYSNHENVTESFENSFFEGIKVVVYSNLMNRLGLALKGVLKYAYNNSGVVSLFAVFILFLQNIIRNQFYSFSDLGIEGIFNLSVVILYIITAIINWIIIYKRRKLMRRVRYPKQSNKWVNKKWQAKSKLGYIMKKINKNKMLKNEIDPHAILYLMYSLYVLQKTKKD